MWTILGVGKNLEKQKLLYTAGGKFPRYNHLKNMFANKAEYKLYNLAAPLLSIHMLQRNCLGTSGLIN